MHLHAFRSPGGTPTPHLLQVWVLLLVAPACFALVMVPMTIAVAAVTVALLLAWRPLWLSPLICWSRSPAR